MAEILQTRAIEKPSKLTAWEITTIIAGAALSLMICWQALAGDEDQVDPNDDQETIVTPQSPIFTVMRSQADSWNTNLDLYPWYNFSWEVAWYNSDINNTLQDHTWTNQSINWNEVNEPEMTNRRRGMFTVANF